MDEKLLQNTLAEATTEMGFPAKTNTPLQKEVTLEDGTKVIVEGITPDKMKTVLNQNVDGTEEAVTFKTPGEVYKNEEVELPGVCQIYNSSIIEPDLVSLEVTTEPTKTTYYEGDTFDSTGMVVTGHYSNGTTKEVTNYTITPSGALSTSDESVNIAVGDIDVDLAITVQEDNIASIAVTTEPTKTTYAIGDTFDPTGLVVTATFDSSKTEVLDNSELTFNPDTETQLTAEDTSVTINYYELSCTQAITVE